MEHKTTKRRPGVTSSVRWHSRKKSTYACLDTQRDKHNQTQLRNKATFPLRKRRQRSLPQYANLLNRLLHLETRSPRKNVANVLKHGKQSIRHSNDQWKKVKNAKTLQLFISRSNFQPRSMELHNSPVPKSHDK